MMVHIGKGNAIPVVSFPAEGCANANALNQKVLELLNALSDRIVILTFLISIEFWTKFMFNFTD